MTKMDRLYSYLNDMRFGIAPDETVRDDDERGQREAQVDVIDDIMEWIEKESDTETWNGIHAQIAAPKGTFEKIFNDAEEGEDDI